MKKYAKPTMMQQQKLFPTDHSKKATLSSTLKAAPATRSAMKGKNQGSKDQETMKNNEKTKYTDNNSNNNSNNNNQKNKNENNNNNNNKPNDIYERTSLLTERTKL
jgi:hypothetical protein